MQLTEKYINYYYCIEKNAKIENCCKLLNLRNLIVFK